MRMMRNLAQTLEYRYPEPDQARINEALSVLATRDDTLYVVIDDDPTGGQTVHGIRVYTCWDEPSIEHAFRETRRMFYIMTNSRAMTRDMTIEAHRQIMGALRRASLATGRAFSVISRGDSTLRGHYPQEIECIQAGLLSPSKQLLIPFFPEGGRYTMGDVHYLMADGALVPVGESEFSRDQTFGFKSSNLKHWIAEKTSGRCPSERVGSIPLDMLRALDFEGIEAALMNPDVDQVVVNACCYADLRSFAVGYLRAMRHGARFAARTAAAWPKVIGLVPDAQLLGRDQLRETGSGMGGLVIVGSHVNTTTEQLRALREGMPALCYIEFDQHQALRQGGLKAQSARAAQLASDAMLSGRTAVVYTRRERLDLPDSDPEQQLLISKRISDAVTEVAQLVDVHPAFIISKGGITSSDIATEALKVRCAEIIGQAQPGVPVWRLGDDSRFPGMPYIIFPGNVGARESLLELLQLLTPKGDRKGAST